MASLFQNYRNNIPHVFLFSSTFFRFALQLPSVTQEQVYSLIFEYITAFSMKYILHTIFESSCKSDLGPGDWFHELISNVETLSAYKHRSR